MSRLDDLIQELCPDGVDYKTISDISIKIVSGGTPRTGVSEYYNGDIPWLRTQEVDFNDIIDTELKITEIGVVKSSAKLIPENCVIVAMYGATVGKVAINKIPLTTNQACCNIQVNPDIASYKYVFYCLSNMYKYIKSLGKGSQTNINAQIVKELRIPIPPLEVQKEIVRLLDDFTAKTAELQAELNKEYEARKKQYEYYRDTLLNKNEKSKIVSLRDTIKKSCSGGTPKKDNPDYYENGTIPWIRTQDVKFNEITDVEGRITEKAIKETSAKWIPQNCVIVAISGATAGRCAVNKIKAATNQHCLNLEIDSSKANYKYIYYAVCDKHEELISKKQGARGDLNSSLVLDTKIPLPSLEVQNRLVEVLDNFDSICSDLNIDLPAEIEARQKQYEFYRDKLLTFKELNGSEVN